MQQRVTPLVVGDVLLVEGLLVQDESVQLCLAVHVAGADALDREVVV
jgi:hypothetical protein